MAHPHTPMCAFCWPRLVLAETIDRETQLPCCLKCDWKDNKAPSVPRFLWDRLRQIARTVFNRTQQP